MGPILFTNARLLDPDTGLDLEHGSLLVVDGRIADVGRDLGRPDGAQAIELPDGAVLAPGLIDIRAHVGEPGHEYRETIASVALSAAAGGITTIAALPDTTPAIDNPALVHWLRARGEETGTLSILPYGALTVGCAGKELTEIGLLTESGAIAFTDASRTIAPARLMRRALTYARGFDVLIAQHPEEPSLATGGAATEGELAMRLGLPGIPPAAEAIQIACDLRLLKLTGGRLHFAHVSTAEAIRLITEAKDQGLAVTADTAPPYFDLNELAIGEFRTYAKLSPPLRAEEDRAAIASALASGAIDAVASDHQPHEADQKRVPLAEAAPGGAGLTTLLGVTLAQVHSGAITLLQALNLLTASPARLLRIEGGRLAKGVPADLCIFHPSSVWKVEAGELPGKAQNTPFDGRALEGRVLSTWKSGRRVFPRDPAASERT